MEGLDGRGINVTPHASAHRIWRAMTICWKPLFIEVLSDRTLRSNASMECLDQTL
ncbi:hypothetical protein [Roseateles amylovorans]|uniref:Uncharacterized protein n=1 Tax=Roseateles amylovorans TaxID=2978473 RepID=A0ABY6B563_9BURK|nr:hypothetical protein [Roseateles amylovorans]UXH80521.1 hypothetical protein N4261_11885 [Roseateles amylovorans]